MTESHYLTDQPANHDKKVIVGMSGGVDSSVSTLILMHQGYKVEGLFMKNWDEDDGTEYCTVKDDLADARSVSDKLGIKLHTANFAAEYWDNVFEHFLEEYKAGRTPNPDILCNKEIKFKVFLEYALELGADYIATGHYVRRGEKDGQPVLLKGLDTNKDQSYFLYAVGKNEIGRSLFPVGEFKKPEVRRLAEEFGLITYNKKDSTGICFIGERRFKDFLEQYLPTQPGAIETLAGDRIGKHHGLMYHTIGQRRGLGIGGLSNYPDGPWYVVGKDLDRNVLIVTQGDQHESLFKTHLIVNNFDWVAREKPSLPLICRAKCRYRQPDQDCIINELVDGQVEIAFKEPQRAITPGQSVVFYVDDHCLGGGIINVAFNK